MFKLKGSIDFYKNGFSEYLIEKYPPNFFNYGIDVGASGVVHKWAINHMGKDNPNTLLIGLEPDKQFFDVINNECRDLNNVIIIDKYFGNDLSLKDLVNIYNINIDSKWYISCDCEGGEKYLFSNSEDLEILKKCSHIAMEIHPELANISSKEFLELFHKYFGNTHKIIRTFNGDDSNGNSSFVLIDKKIYYVLEPLINKFMAGYPGQYGCTKYHYITMYN